MRKMLLIPLFIATLSTSGSAVAAERKVTLAVENMFCAACPFIVENALSNVAGVISASTSYEKQTAEVVFDDALTNIQALEAATTEHGYPSKLKN